MASRAYTAPCQTEAPCATTTDPERSFAAGGTPLRRRIHPQHMAPSADEEYQSHDR